MKKTANLYNLLLSLGAFYIAFLMISGTYDTFPKEWIGQLPFNSWMSLALFGAGVFGIGNAVISIYGFVKSDKNMFLMTCVMGALFLLATIIATKLVGEWYLITGQFLILGIIQLSVGFIGIVFEKLKRKEKTTSKT